MTDEAAVDIAGAEITGDIDPNVTFSKSDLTCDIFVSNDAGEDTIE